ncbi:MAG: hypothetical protein ACI9EW_001185 [Cellvibrionaceae bacterium]|jgi:hypothetical protein
MVETAINSRYNPSADEIADKRIFYVIRNITFLAIVSLITIYYALQSAPDWTNLAWATFAIALVTVFWQPHFGIYAIMFFSLVGDSRISYYLPFDKNLSSEESIFFLNNSAAISPVEILFTLLVISWLLGLIIRRELYKIKYGGIFWSTAAFTVMIMIALAWGILRNGDLSIAQLEVRPILYIAIMMVLTRNLITNPKQINILFWCIAFALFIEGILAYQFVIANAIELNGELTEHSASIHYNTIFVLGIASWIVVKGSWVKRSFLFLLFPPILYSFLASDRRSAMLGLILALALTFLFLYQERKFLFLVLLPTLSIGIVIYLGLFWNNTSALGKPAQTIKSVVAEDETNEKDQSSNFYRYLENLNSYYTVQQHPIMGVGFGNKFLQIAQMPDISFFIFWEYITHNSIFWIWIQSGVFGFMTMLYMVSVGVMNGARVAWTLPSSEIKVFAIVSVTYLFMHFLYAYVDISWTSQSMLYVGTVLGLISVLEDFQERLNQGESIEDLYLVKS